MGESIFSGWLIFYQNCEVTCDYSVLGDYFTAK